MCSPALCWYRSKITGPHHVGLLSLDHFPLFIYDLFCFLFHKEGCHSAIARPALSLRSHPWLFFMLISLFHNLSAPHPKDWPFMLCNSQRCWKKGKTKAKENALCVKHCSCVFWRCQLISSYFKQILWSSNISNEWRQVLREYWRSDFIFHESWTVAPPRG